MVSFIREIMQPLRKWIVNFVSQKVLDLNWPLWRSFRKNTTIVCCPSLSQSFDPVDLRSSQGISLAKTKQLMNDVLCEVLVWAKQIWDGRGLDGQYFYGLPTDRNTLFAFLSTIFFIHTFLQYVYSIFFLFPSFVSKCWGYALGKVGEWALRVGLTGNVLMHSL